MLLLPLSFLGREVVGEAHHEIRYASDVERLDRLFDVRYRFSLAEDELVRLWLAAGILFEALHLDRDHVAGFRPAFVCRNPLSILFPETLDDPFYLVVIDQDVGPFHRKAPYAGDFEVRLHVERDRERQVLFGLEVNVLNLSLRDRANGLLGKGFPVRVADDRVQGLLIQCRPVPLLEDSLRHAAFPETRQLEARRQFLRDLGPLRLHEVGRNRDVQGPTPAVAFFEVDAEFGTVQAHFCPSLSRIGTVGRTPSAKGGTRTPTALGHRILNPARLPIPPLSRV